MKNETAQKAAKWWADQLRGNAKFDCGGNAPTDILTRGLASMLQKHEKEGQSPALIDRFETELTNDIMEREHVQTISTDYRPGDLLQQAADRAGLRLGRTTLPCKTIMRIVGEKVSVACGYGAKSVEV